MAKKTFKTLKNKLDAVYSRYIRAKHYIPVKGVQCVTCKQWFDIKNIHCGHFQKRRHMSTRWFEKNTHPQCCKCNTFNDGEQFLHGQYIDETYGPGTAKAIENLTHVIQKYTTSDLAEMIERYQCKTAMLISERLTPPQDEVLK